MNDDKRIRRKVLRSYVVSTISIALVLFLLGSVGYMLYSAISTAQELKHSVTISAELENELSDEDKEAIKQKIMSVKGVSKCTYSSKEEKIGDKEFQRMFDADIEQVLGENPLRNSFEVNIAASERKVMDAVVAQIEQIEGVVYVAYPAATIERMHTSIRKIMIILTAFCGALLFISLILLNNTIRLAIYSRRHLINTFKLVGATKWYIMKPLLWTAFKQGLWAGVIASLMFVASLLGLRETLPEIISMASMTKYCITIGIIVGSGLTISILFTTFAVNKFVNMQSNKIRLY